MGRVGLLMYFCAVIGVATGPLVSGLALGLGGLDSPGPGSGQALHQPATVSSPSGRFALRVLPADREGCAGAHYTLILDGEPLWSRELPFAFRRFVVRDDGVAAGFAHSYSDREGRRGLRLAALAPDGELLWVHPAQDAPIPSSEHFSEFSLVGIHLHGDGETLMLRSKPDGRGEGSETWWAIELSNGAVDDGVTLRLPKPLHGPRMASMAGRGVPGTPLALVCWTEYGYGRPADGLRYILHAPDGRSVWELYLPDELGSSFLSEAQAEAALLAVGERSFELALLKDDLRVGFTVEPDGRSRWIVRETGREPLGGLPTHTPPVDITPWRTVDLEFLGEVTFAADVDAPLPDEPPGPLVAFDVDAAGRIGCVHRVPGSEQLAFALLDGDGRVLRSFELHSEETPECVRWVGGSTWFLHSSGARPSGAWLDLEHGEVIEIPDCNGEIVDAELHPDGDLVVAGRDSLHRFAPPGSAGEVAERPWSDPRFEQRVRQLAIRPDGALAVAIDARPARIELLRPDGVRAHVVELGRQLGESGRLEELLAPSDGTLWFRGLVADQAEGPSAWHRLDANLRPLDPVVPWIKNGADVSSLLERVGPDGRGWGADAWGPIRFDLVRHHVQPVGRLRVQPLGEFIGAITVDPQGRIYLTGEGDAIFVFDAEGVLLHVCRPERGDSARSLDMVWISVRGDGHVFGGDRWDQRIEFDEHGRSLGVHVVDSLEDFWTFWPGGLKAWVALWPGTIELRGLAGELEASVDRLHDGRWFSGAWPLSVARDGSVAFSRLDALHVFDASGAPRGSRSIAYEAEEPGCWHPTGILHEGERTILSSDGRLIAIHWDDPVAEVFELPQSKEGKLFRSPDGAELWLFPLHEPRMLRFASPPNWR